LLNFSLIVIQDIKLFFSYKKAEICSWKQPVLSKKDDILGCFSGRFTYRSDLSSNESRNQSQM